MADPIAQAFGYPILQGYKPGSYETGGHPGVDINEPATQPVYAIQAGTLDWKLSGPLQETVQLPNGLYETYGHVDINPNLKPNQQINVGDLLGYVDSRIGGPGTPYPPISSELFDNTMTAYHSTQPHVHFGVSSNPTSAEYLGGDPTIGTYGILDPETYLTGGYSQYPPGTVAHNPPQQKSSSSSIFSGFAGLLHTAGSDVGAGLKYSGEGLQYSAQGYGQLWQLLTDPVGFMNSQTPDSVWTWIQKQGLLFLILLGGLILVIAAIIFKL